MTRGASQLVCGLRNEEHCRCNAAPGHLDAHWCACGASWEFTADGERVILTPAGAGR